MTLFPNATGQPNQILIVDDDRRNRELLEAMLAPSGFVLRSAASGKEALRMVAQLAPDLILLDIMMPGMDGFEVTEEIKNNPATENILVILITALDDRATRMRGLSAGAEDFLTKPVERAELTTRVRNLLRLKSYGDYYGQYSELLEAKVASRTADLVKRSELLEEQAILLTEQAGLLDLAHDAIIVRDLDSRILFWSRGAEVMYGRARKDALGKNIAELLKADFGEPIEQIQATVLRESHWEGEAIHHRADGTNLTVSSRWALQKSENGAPLKILTIDTDISDRKQTESESSMLTNRLALAAAVAKVGVWEWDLASDALIWDATMFEIYGIPPVAPMLHEKWAAVVHPKDLAKTNAAMQKIITEKGQGSAEHRLVLADGSIRTVSNVARVVLDEHANVRRLIGVNMDITERKRVEEEIISARNLAQETARVKSEFLANVNHELRTPMNAILGLTEVLLDTKLTEDQREYLDIVKRSADSLLMLIENTLTFSDYDDAKLETVPFDVEESVSESVKLFSDAAQQKKIKFLWHISPDVPGHLEGDPKRLRKALRLLIDNAVKFTKSGEISVGVEQEACDGDEIKLRFTIRDTGIGIPTDRQEMIFSPFTQLDGSRTRAYGGTGLGLTVCRRLVEMLGGSLWVLSSPGAGSAFHFTAQFSALK